MIDSKGIKRVLVITLSNIGDVILTTPVVEALIQNFPYVKLDIVVGPNGKEIFEGHKKISKIFIYDKYSNLFDKFRLIKKLRKMHYDLAIDLKNSLIPFLIGARFKSKVIRRTKDIMHKKDEHLSLLKSMGINTGSAKLNIEITKEDFDKTNRLLEGIKRKFIVVSCGAKSHTKRWPASYFAALIDYIKREMGYEVILVGKGQGDSPDSDKTVIGNVKKISGMQPIDFVDKTNLRELAALIKKSSLLITNDSAPLHIAGAFDTPTIAIFGPTDERKYGPLAKKSIVLRKNLDCTPCEKPQCRYDYECTREITIQDAIKAVREILKT